MISLFHSMMITKPKYCHFLFKTWMKYIMSLLSGRAGGKKIIWSESIAPVTFSMWNKQRHFPIQSNLTLSSNQYVFNNTNFIELDLACLSVVFASFVTFGVNFWTTKFSGWFQLNFMNDGLAMQSAMRNISRLEQKLQESNLGWKVLL